MFGLCWMVWFAAGCFALVVGGGGCLFWFVSLVCWVCCCLCELVMVGLLLVLWCLGLMLLFGSLVYSI